MKEQPKKDRKRGGDITGRAPARTTIKSVMHQGTGKTAPTSDNIGTIMRQGASTPKASTPLKLKSILRQG